MPAAKAFRAKTVTFAATALTGILDVSVNDSGSPVDLLTDASPTVQAVFIDSIVTEVTIATTDLAASSLLIRGVVGSLVIVFEIRAEGSGAGSPNRTATFATAVLVSNSSQASATGVGSMSLTFRCSGPNGTTVTWS